jgi:hypothetical protein
VWEHRESGGAYSLLDRLCWWRRRRVRGRKRQHSEGADSSFSRAASQSAKVIRIDAATSVETARVQDSSCQTWEESCDVAVIQSRDSSSQTHGHVEKKWKEEAVQTEVGKMEGGRGGRREEKEGRRKEEGKGGKEELISWLDYPFLTDRRSIQHLQSSQVPVPSYQVFLFFPREYHCKD